MINLNQNQIDVSIEKHLIGIILFLLSSIGCLAIYNAKSLDPNPLYLVSKQFSWAIIGLTIYYFSSCIRFNFYIKHIVTLNLIFWIPLLGVLFLGDKINGMNGWFVLFKESFPVFIQPAEIGKPIYILTICYISFYFKKEPLKIILMFLYFIFWALPIMLQPDFGTTVFYTFGFFTAYWLSGGRKYFLLVFALISLTLLIIFILYNPYVLTRIYAFWDPLENSHDTGWHLLQFRYSIARGGFDGVGLGKAYWANAYLPLPYTDSIFASLVESLGLLGVLPIIFGFIILLYFTYILSTNKNNAFLITLSCTLISCITFQTLLHISVNVGLFPITGVTLPLISYGGSSLVSIMLCFGILLSMVNTVNNN